MPQLSKQSHPSKPRNAGFTLTELLVVITITAVLASVLMTVVGRMRESARQTGCLSNLRNIGAAVFLYSTDNNDNMPFEISTTPENPTGHSSIWQIDLGAYIPYAQPNTSGKSDRDGKVQSLPGSPFHCPSAKKERSWLGMEPDYAAISRHGSGPGTQGIFSRNAWGAFYPPLKRALIRQPERCMLVFDACNGSSVLEGAWGVTADTRSALKTISAAVPKSCLAPRHGYNGKDSRTGRFGVVFCDGHVEAMSYGDPRLRDPAFIDALTIPY